MTKRLDILKKKNQRLIDVPDDFLKKLNKVQKGSYNFIAAKISQFKTLGETISKSEANFLLVEELKNDLKDYLKKGDYTKAVREFSREFSEQKKLSKEYFDEIASGKEYATEVANTISVKIQKTTVQKLVNDSLTKDFLTPLTTVLDNAVATGSSYLETLKSIRAFVEGNEDVDGAILKYSKQIAHDSFANADRAYGSAVADELEGEWFLWNGEELDSSRCFCIERKGKYFHYKEIESWGRGEDVGGCGADWAGKNRDTNEKTIFTYGGGYGCLDTISMVSIFDVPKEDVMRNVDNGNYELSEFEMEFFG